MNELFSKISNQLTEFWKKFEIKQKILIIIIAAVILVALSIAGYIASKPKMKILSSNLKINEASSIIKILKENEIIYKTKDEGTTILVDSRKFTDAKYALAESDIPKLGFTYQDAYNTSMSENETIKKDKLKRAKETELANHIASKIDAIENAVVQLVIPDYDRLFVDSQRESSASVILTTKYQLNQEQIQSIVRFVQFSVENLKPGNISIMDQNAKMLYNGEIENGSPGALNKRYEIEDMKKKEIREAVKRQLPQFDDVRVSINLVMDFDEYNAMKETHVNPVGDSNTGLVTEEIKQSSSSKNTEAGKAPGIDSNPGETQYAVSASNNGSESKSDTSNKKYIYNSIKSQEVKSIGNVIYDKSSISVVVVRKKIYDQNLMEQNGKFKNITWEQFKQENSAEKNFDVDNNIISTIQYGTGINNVKAYGIIKPVFIDKEVVKKPVKEYIPIIIVALILLLLAYVVYKGMEPVEITEIEPELSVEDMLSKSLDEEVEEIQDDGSGVKKEIERFVDEKPEAAAQLLRNWLNEDWE